MDIKNKNMIKSIKLMVKHDFKNVKIFPQIKQSIPKFHSIFNEFEKEKDILLNIKKPTIENILNKNGMNLKDKIDMLKFHNPKLHKLLA